MIRSIIEKFRKKSKENPYEHFESLKGKLKKDDLLNNLTIFDVGAFQGDLSVKLSMIFPGSSVYAFEPVSENFNVLKSKTNSIKRISSFNIALGETDHAGTININHYGETNSILASNRTNTFIDDLTSKISSEQIVVKTLDSICAELDISRIDLLKLDVQGYELNVLKGAVHFLSTRKVNYILCEVEFIEIYKDQPLFDDIIDFLKKYGYSLVDIYNLNYTPDGNLAWCDMLIKRK